MFRFLEISLHGWDLWPAMRVPLARDVVLILGPNGSGKTTFLDAIRQILNAPRLSSRRRLQHYLRRPDRPALLRAVVSNRNGEPGAAPFRRERILTSEVTLACALVPSGSGTPEKRFAVAPGRVGVEELQARLLESRDWYGPERYARVLEAAGVSRSLMSVLAIEQGRTNSLFDLKPRELFVKVLDMLGDRVVLERYQDARSQYAATRSELARQTEALTAKQAELQRILREVQRLDEYQRAAAKVADLESRLPAAELQSLLRRRHDLAPKLQELRTKVKKGEGEQVRLAELLERARRAENDAAARLARAKQAESEAVERRAACDREDAVAAEEQERLEDLAREAAALPAGDLEALGAELERVERNLFDLDARLEATGDRMRLLEEKLEQLEAGRSVFPDPVTATLKSLREAGVSATLLADVVEVTEASLAGAIESALGRARFALTVPANQAETAIDLARKNGFPGPVFSGDTLASRTTQGPLSLGAGAPAWLPGWLENIEFHEDGSWRDQRGTWVERTAESYLGERGRRGMLQVTRERLGDARRERRRLDLERTAVAELRQRARAAYDTERRRLELLEEVERLPRVAERRRTTRRALDRAIKQWEQAVSAREQANREQAAAAGELARIEKETNLLSRQLQGEKRTLAELDVEYRSIEDNISQIEAGLPAALRILAQQGKLDGPDTVRSDLQRAREYLQGLDDPPAPEVREEAEQLRRNVEELERHTEARRREMEEAGRELDACRERYLEVVSGALRDYRSRVASVASVAEVEVEMELPALSNDDRVLEEASITVRFGFDGKDPLPLGHPSFSGGQQVIAGLILLMGMAEIEGQGFFMLDEPFAHLSLDRIDQVGRFLRATHSQFILTAPTTLDRSQLDPASLVIVLRKKASAAAAAPVPIVAEA